MKEEKQHHDYVNGNLHAKKYDDLDTILNLDLTVGDNLDVILRAAEHDLGHHTGTIK